MEQQDDEKLSCTDTNEVAVARDEDRDDFQHRPEPHTGEHKHVCPRCFVEWFHQPEKCFLKAISTCINCLREKEEIKGSVN